jgi:stage II sporulation protein D
MKKLVYYAGMMIAVIILLPLFIVKGCGPSWEPKPPDKATVGKDYKISVYNETLKKSEEMNLEEYIKGVVAAEMPADFDPEALKAQAVAARTFAYGRMTGVYKSKEGVHDGVDICTDSTHCQAWTSKENAMKKWKVLFASRNWSKIEKAVNSTKGMIVAYNGNIANTLFHASSSGKTENSDEVWSGVSVPYLRSVTSSGEEESKGYITSILIKTSELVGKLRKAYPEAEFAANIFKSIKIIDYTTGGRVKTLKIGNISLKGTEFRTLLGLRSTDFKVEIADEGKDGTLKITTKGFGHGVGMSQWGADSLAKRGGTYTEILKHYYTGVDVILISEYESK